ncbi:unnamed protein product, partial [Adineta steineri]
RSTVTLQLPPDISKLEYLDFYSSDPKTEDSYGKLMIERRHGKKPILKF